MKPAVREMHAFRARCRYPGANEILVTGLETVLRSLVRSRPAGRPIRRMRSPVVRTRCPGEQPASSLCRLWFEAGREQDANRSADENACAKRESSVQPDRGHRERREAPMIIEVDPDDPQSLLAWGAASLTQT